MDPNPNPTNKWVQAQVQEANGPKPTNPLNFSINKDICHSFCGGSWIEGRIETIKY